MFEGGFLGTGITRAARLLSSPNVWLTNYPLVLVGQRIGFRYQPVTGAFAVVPVFVPNPTGPFPYGQAVQPP